MASGIIPVEKLRTTPMGAERIRRNLGLDCDDVIAWCRSAIHNIPDKSVIREGKNWYVYGDGFVLTINASAVSIITAHKTSKQIESSADEKASRRSVQRGNNMEKRMIIRCHKKNAIYKP